MTPQKRRRVIGILILLISLVFLLWGIWPFASQVRLVPISPDELQLPTPESFLPALMWLV